MDAIKKGFKPTGEKAMDAVDLAALIQYVEDGGKGYKGAEQAGVG